MFSTGIQSLKMLKKWGGWRTNGTNRKQHGKMIDFN